jgi:pyruvate kinase
MPSTLFLCTGTGDLFVESLSISTLTKKGKSYILQLVVPNNIGMTALSFVKKGSDLQMV